MATKKPTNIRKIQKTSTSDDSKNSSTGNDINGGNNSGARRKTKTTGTIVKSRYMQTEQKPAVKHNVQNETTLLAPKPASPRVSSTRKVREGAHPRRTLSTPSDSTLMTSILESSHFGGSVLQSTVLDGHCIRPDLDVSVIKDKIVPPSTVEPKNQERNMEMETFLLAFLTAKIESNNQKMREEAEKNLLTVMDKEQQLHAKVNCKKRQYLLLEKQKQHNSILDLQIEALGPVAAAANKFSEEYESFATAVDATRHKLPVKNVHVGENTGDFLDKAVGCLNESERVLQQYTQNIPKDCEASAECLREMRTTANEISQQLTRTFSDLLEVSSLVSRETVLVQQSLEENQIGLNTAQTLFCPTVL